MSLRAPDIKDERGWQIVNEEGVVIGHALSRDKARSVARTGEIDEDVTVTVNGRAEFDPRLAWQPVPAIPAEAFEALNGEVLPPDDSPEAVVARHAWDVHQQLRRAVLAEQVIWVVQATYLYEIYSERLWEKLGDGFESFDAYLADPDTDIDNRKGYYLVQIYKDLVIDKGVDPEQLKTLNISKVMAVLPAVRRKQLSIEEAIADCKTLTKKAITLKLSGRASKTKGKPDTGTGISTENEPKWIVCATCGSRYQVDETGARL